MSSSETFRDKIHQVFFSSRTWINHAFSTAEPSNKFDFQLMECNRHHKKLEELVVYHSVKRGTIKEEYDYSLPFKPYLLPCLKKLNMVCSVSSEW